MKFRANPEYVELVASHVTSKPEKPREIAARVPYGAPSTIRRVLSLLAHAGQIQVSGEERQRVYWSNADVARPPGLRPDTRPGKQNSGE